MAFMISATMDGRKIKGNIITQLNQDSGTVLKGSFRKGKVDNQQNHDAGEQNGKVHVAVAKDTDFSERIIL